MAQITVTLTDEQLDLFLQGQWTPNVTLDSGQTDESGQPILITKSNVSKLQMATNNVVNYINGIAERNARQASETAAKLAAEQVIQTEVNRVSKLPVVEPVLTQEEIDAKLAELEQNK